MRKHYEVDDKTFPAAAYKVERPYTKATDRDKGIAWYVLGWETEPDEDTEWTGYENRTGKVICIMVGDDRHFSIDPDELTALDGEEFCHSCGQIGCTCNVYS